MRLRTVFFSLLAFWLGACNNTGPSGPDFLISSVEFTGDSTGTEPASRGVESIPYCEFTVEWDVPVPDAGYEYTVYRSREPGIESNPENAEELAVLFNCSWVDSEGLDWNSGYYYAVKAVPAQGRDRWSDEVFVQSPVSPFPVPGDLSYEKFFFTICALSWEACTDSRFQSACLLRSRYEDIEHQTNFTGDTLLITTEHGAGFYTDSTITDSNPRYYVLAVKAGGDIVSYSNEVCFTPGADFPWYLNKSYEIGSANVSEWSNFGLLSQDSHRVYFHYSSDYSGEGVVAGIESEFGSRFGTINCGKEVLCLAERPDGSILVTFRDANSVYHLSQLSQNLSTVVQTVDFDRPVSSIIETPEGILCTSVNKALILDPVSFEIVDSLPHPFTTAVAMDSWNRLFLLTGSGVKVLRRSDLKYMEMIDGPFTDIQAGLDSNLYCFSETGIEWYDALDLSLQGTFTFPHEVRSAAVLPGREYIAYEYYYSSMGEHYLFDIYDTRSGDLIGTVENIPQAWGLYVFLFPSWGGEFLWGFIEGNALSRIQCFSVTI